MATVQYENTTALGLLGTHPRAVYRMTLERSGLSAVSYALGVLSWPGQVLKVVDRIAGSGYGIPLGGPMPSPNDQAAVIEVRAPTASASGDSVGDLVRIAEEATPYARVVRVARLAPVPGAGTPAEAERDAGRQAEQARASADAAKGLGFLDGLRNLGSRASWAVTLGLGLGIVVIAVLVIGPSAERIGRAANWTGGES